MGRCTITLTRKRPDSPEEFNAFKKSISFMDLKNGQGLEFVSVDLNIVRLVVITDAAFSNTYGAKIQHGYALLMVDDKDHANIIHNGSKK